VVLPTLHWRSNGADCGVRCVFLVMTNTWAIWRLGVIIQTLHGFRTKSLAHHVRIML
jgi:hypothetical protein